MSEKDGTDYLYTLEENDTHRRIYERVLRMGELRAKADGKDLGAFVGGYERVRGQFNERVPAEVIGALYFPDIRNYDIIFYFITGRRIKNPEQLSPSSQEQNGSVIVPLDGERGLSDLSRGAPLNA